MHRTELYLECRFFEVMCVQSLPGLMDLETLWTTVISVSHWQWGPSSSRSSDELAATDVVREVGVVDLPSL
jgi:hypothetical protein